MTQYLINLLISVICQLLTFSFIRILHRVERECIIEVGYRSQSKKYKAPSSSLPLRDRILHWSLCREATINTKIVWIYFATNGYLVTAAIGSAVLACVSVVCFTPRNALLHQLEYFIFILFSWGIGHFFLDLFFLPSEQKRYGIKKRR